MKRPGICSATTAPRTLSSLTDWQSRTITLTYDSNSNRTGINRPNGVNSTYAYDLADRATSIMHTGPGGMKSFSYTYDAGWQPEVSDDRCRNRETYVFGLNRITAATYTNGDLVEYTYDANGNRLTKKLNSVTTNTYTYDNADQLTSDGSTSYTYDNNGNMTAAGTSTFSWGLREPNDRRHGRRYVHCIRVCRRRRPHLEDCWREHDKLPLGPRVYQS